MQKLSKGDFKVVEKFVVGKGDNPNEDRCVVISIDFEDRSSNVTCCMDEIENELRVCQVNGQGVDILTETVYEIELIELSKNAAYNETEEKKYINYIEEIKMETDCCDRDCSSCNNNKVF
jgi:hypothetical protein